MYYEIYEGLEEKQNKTKVCGKKKKKRAKTDTTFLSLSNLSPWFVVMVSFSSLSISSDL